MNQFINIEKSKDRFELTISPKMFAKDVVLKTAYNFLDKGYFLFSFDKNGDIIAQFTKRDGVNVSLEEVISDFSDELLNVYLRTRLEKENKKIREAIIGVALGSSLDNKNFVSFDVNEIKESGVDFDKDIDQILKEIENDPDLKIDEAEIERILKEIEEESK